jgi:hypothetical protein
MSGNERYAITVDGVKTKIPIRRWLMLKRSLSVAGIALFAFASVGFAQVPGNPNASLPPVAHSAAAPPTASSKPFTSFSAIGAGTASVDLLAPCAGVICSTGDTCQCLTISGATLKSKGLGNSTLVANLNLDATTNLPNGAADGFCDLASGPGTITAANGDQVTVDFTGSFCVGFNFVNFVINGGYTIVGGTGKLANAAGTGSYAFSASEITLPGEAAVVMNGSFRKKP